ncbi:LysR substrate-binding protein [Gordonia bronchialis DSM 43247]|uniref:LysR substrate-binding protein n=1 Tax=Gordonia bronchialis (strain ATCC 25592 / DSM 43247 / BCRC 13721 / JCM 3198 / KCTC 3076 / NBRC 16047 / NCTC 10667) TaxID=526226 RepID=D0L7S7_GORB4|nr:LysR family transcriptional regulator [Gordonia bronchialis]ACY20940.1 LysR substrate-binding protein [Gordonia bronchialis DSM 43247]MCC3323713.1 LysR family transcriptional regulator [Gordonia bronchialis]QGS25334.1 LysR family transcriptional regulator [Gordonia bronchialis]STQ63785.1 HTH-type transcriptional regulator gltC [Gordonia bronchialis]
MELHQLRYALAVVDAGTFTAGAQAVRVSQSGVSMQIAKLERELGVALFDRTSRRVALTDAGRTLLPAMRQALAAADAVTAAAGEIRGVLAGSLRVGAVTGLTWEPLVDALAAMHARHPGIDVRLTEGLSDDLVVCVREGSLDIAVAGWAGREPRDLLTTVIVDDALCAVVAPDHPWASRQACSVDDLLSTDVIALPTGTGARTALDTAAQRAGRHASPRWEVTTPAQVVALARRGIGVGALSVTTAAGFEGVLAIPLTDAAARSSLGVVSRHDPSPAARAFRTLLGH